MKYINAEKLKVEIERRIEICAKQREDMLNVQCHALVDDASARMAELNCIQNFIDTLEVKEVDLDNNMTDINFEEEIDNFNYGTRNPERFPDSFLVRDEHTGLNVLDWKAHVNNPKYRIEFAKYFFELGLQVSKSE